MPERSGFGRARAFEQISRELLRARGEQFTLQRVSELAVETIPACDECGVSIRRADRSVDTPACTSPLVEKADGMQYEFVQGPCLESVWQLDTYLIGDLASDSRWPRWAPAALGLGFRSILSVRLDTPEHTLGWINLYAYTPHAFDNTDVIMARLNLDQSFEVLRCYSQGQNIKLRQLAEQLVRAGAITDGIEETLADDQDQDPV